MAKVSPLGDTSNEGNVSLFESSADIDIDKSLPGSSKNLNAREKLSATLQQRPLSVSHFPTEDSDASESAHQPKFMSKFLSKR